MALQETSTRMPFRIPLGVEFKPIAWKARYHMDFSVACLYCGKEGLVGYGIENHDGAHGHVVVCEECRKTNGNYH
ncbi:hypothetical protein [Rubeoparvulum massiliense]|uniref:hypothetical protein n=1 Tax=Rubeoparvulum massiliense TaxID=1631346 RepID=UPI00065DC7B1|nr:hypothetical protein [Rubeoparvulum massiliense]